MKPEDRIDQALNDQLPDEAWEVLLKDEAALADLRRQIEMDALLRVALEPVAKGQRLNEAILASAETRSVESLRQDIELATIGHRRRARQRLGGPFARWKAVAPRLWQAAAAVVLGALVGSLAWPDMVSQVGLEEIVAQHQAESRPAPENPTIRLKLCCVSGAETHGLDALPMLVIRVCRVVIAPKRSLVLLGSRPATPDSGNANIS